MSQTPPHAPRRRRAGLDGRAAGSVNGNGGAPGGPPGAGNGRPRALGRRRRAGLYRQAHRRPRSRRAVRILLFALAIFATLSATVVGVAFAGYNIYKAELPDAATIAGMEPPLNTNVYDASGQLIYVFHSDTWHDHVALSNVSRWVKLATVDIEDRHFYDEGSWDLPRIVAAGVNDLSHGSTQGASTITEQLAKLSLEGGNLLAPSSRGLDYKVKEIVLGNEISLAFTKDQVLEMYLNRIFYGNQATGIETAAELYFHTTASNLDLAESAMLAGLPQSPSYYNPVSNPDVAKQRQLVVLDAMVNNGDISQAQAHAAFTEKLTYHSWTESDPSLAAGYLDQSFVEYLDGWLKQHYGNAFLSPGGWRIYTTLDPAKQALAQKTVHDQIATNGAKFNMHDASLVTMDPRTGAVLAMVGAWDYNDPHIGQDNMALATVTPGSSIKLFTYSAALASGKYTMTTPILDAPYTFPVPGSAKGYSPQDYDRRWHGTCELKQCLGNSLNMPAVKVEYGTGIPYINNFELAAGLTDLEGSCSNGQTDVPNMPYPTQWAATLGGLACGISVLDLADGAATIANLGVHHDPAPVSKIIDMAASQTMYQYSAGKAGRRVLPDNVAYIMDEITSNDANRQAEFGSHGLLTLPTRRVSAKTGTGEFFQDNLTVGWTPDLLTAVWVGNPSPYCPAGKKTLPDGGPCGFLSGVASGITGAAPIWHDFMVAALGSSPADWYTRPADVVATGPGDNADFFLPGQQSSPGTGCIYWQPAPDPSNPCTYVGTSPPPPSPSPSGQPTPAGQPTPPPQGQQH